MLVEPLDIPDVKLLIPAKHGDHRGFFSEVYNRRSLADAGVHIDFVQDNHSSSADKGTMRGLHFQIPPYAQHKLVRVVRGAAFDVAVDLRRGSPNFGQHIGVVLSAESWSQILVPVGFAHGIMTLVPDTEIVYKVSDYYAPDHDCGIRWNDPALAIEWPIAEDEVILSAKDRIQPMLQEFDTPFDYSPASSGA